MRSGTDIVFYSVYFAVDMIVLTILQFSVFGAPKKKKKTTSKFGHVCSLHLSCMIR